jgi:AcrR family transcriptional regulator
MIQSSICIKKSRRLLFRILKFKLSKKDIKIGKIYRKVSALSGKNHCEEMSTFMNNMACIQDNLKRREILAKDVRTCLLAAFDKLIQTCSLDRMTIHQICQTAGVSRQSFYYHFDDIVDLFSTYIHETLNRQIGETGDHADSFNWSRGLLRLLTFMQNERIKFKHIYHSKFFLDFKMSLEEAVKFILLPSVKTCSHRNCVTLCQREIELIVRFYQYIFVEIILHYIEDDANTPPEKIVTNCQTIMDWSLDDMIVRVAKSRSPQPANPG